ncbi:origin recognition complex subunit 6 [Thrips palmi]|uniref:Origin recognition complex subunit 6 n=1 Tax=Thrips palmi TaxID=161013 RepID=A0A6P9AFM0_THRPL|nr:origin recognition complex subunit 6 [Thrips palmi]
MASSDGKLLSLMAGKMGINSDKALKRASEFLRLLQLKVTASSGLRQFSDTSRVVMCLDLACNKLGYPFDKSNLLKLAGLNKKLYSNGLNLIENLLDLSKPVNINTLCVQLGVSEVASHAQKILDKYVELHAQGPNGARPIDTNMPIYHCASVFMACKHNKVKVDRSQLIEASRVKKVQFDKLIEDFVPVLDNMGPKEVKKSASKRSHKLIDLVTKYDEESKGTENEEEAGQKESSDAEKEDFEVWKKRILGEAYEAN